MADSPRTVTTAPVSATPYRPVSGLAVAGFGVALLAALIIGGMAAASLWTGKPALSVAGLIFAAIGFGLSLAGFLRVRASEGTRAGMGLAQAGLALSALFGLGYAAFALSMEAAVRLQAQRFTNEWLDKLKAGQFEEALRLTLRPDMRENLRPMDVRTRFAEQLEQLREGDLGRAFSHWPDEISFESAGIKDWGYEETGYRVVENYHIRIPEGPIEAAITVQGTEGADGAGRQWQVLLGKTGVGGRAYTKLGILLAETQREMQAFTRNWVAKLGRGQTSEAFLMTRDPAERSKPGEAVPADFPGSLVTVDGKPPTAEEREKYAAAIKSGAINLAPGANPMRPAQPPTTVFGPDGLNYRLLVAITPPGEQPVSAYLNVELIGKELQQELLHLKGPSWERAPLVRVDENYVAGAELKPYPHDYRVIGVDVRPEIKPPEAFRRGVE